MKQLSQQEILSLISFLNKKKYGAGGNCGSFALALARELSNNYNIKILICSSLYEEDLEENDLDIYNEYEPDIYHVAIYIDDVLYDCSGRITEKDVKNIAYEEYSDNEPNMAIYDYSESNDNMFRMVFEWNTNYSVYAEYYQELINSWLNKKEK